MLLITCSDQYYPMGGTADWREIGDNETIQAIWDAKTNLSGKTWYLIEITDNDYRQVDVKW